MNDTTDQEWNISNPRNIPIGHSRVQFFDWGYEKNHRNNPLHRHSFYEICYVADRCGRFFYDDQWFDVGPGDVFVARPGVIHQILSQGMELYWVACKWETDLHECDELSMLLRNAALSDKVVVRDDGRLSQIWPVLRLLSQTEEVASQWQEKFLSSSIFIAICQLICLQLTQGASNQDATIYEAALIRRAVNYIQDNLQSALSLSEVSHFVNLSPRHFCRLFAKYMGCSLVRYTNRLRLETASTLLCSSNQSVREVAEVVGIHDVHYFTRLFTRTFGAPPSRYRYRLQPDVYERAVQTSELYT